MLSNEKRKTVELLRANMNLANDRSIFGGHIPQWFRNRKADAFIAKLPPDIPIDYLPPDQLSNANGNYDKGKISIRNNLKGTKKAITLVHEIAHWLRNDGWPSVEGELDADSTANLIIKHNPAYKRSPEFIKKYYKNNSGYAIE